MFFKKALVSVSDKKNLEDFVVPLAQKGMKVVSTGGTARYLKERGLEVVEVSRETQFPEVMDGRVKTLHPHIHMSLLARGDHPQDMSLLKGYGLEPFDLVVGNLYPFEESAREGLLDKDLVEYIDIGGPSFLRAAAKNFFRITVVVDPSDYHWVLESPELSLDQRKYLASKVFSHTASYDSMISRSLGWSLEFPEVGVGGKKVAPLRYGENPHQKASWYRQKGLSSGLQNVEVIQGKKLSYNNILDVDAAVMTLREFRGGPTCVSVKHNNPCGVGAGSSLYEAIDKSLKADPVSVFGGVIALNEELDSSGAELLTQLFLECIVAPSYTEKALEIFAQKKNLRVLSWPRLMESEGGYHFQSVLGGFLMQETLATPNWNEEWEVIGENSVDLSEGLKDELIFALKVVSRLKSNAIAITGQGQTLGLGMGQVNRVDAVDQAIKRAKEFHPEKELKILASDAFFPFPDSIEKAANGGVQWVIQPGGSIKDDEVKAAVIKRGLNMVLTRQRLFLH